MFHDLHEIYFYISKLLTHLIGLVGFSCEPSAFPLGGSVIRKMIAKTARAPIIGVTRNPHLEDTVIWTIWQTKEWIKIKIKAINLFTLDCKMDLLYEKEGRITILDYLFWPCLWLIVKKNLLKFWPLLNYSFEPCGPTSSPRRRRQPPSRQCIRGLYQRVLQSRRVPGYWSAHPT